MVPWLRKSAHRCTTVGPMRSEKSKEARRIRAREYQRSEQYKALRRKWGHEYRKTEKAKEASRRRHVASWATERGREVARIRAKKYAATEAGRLSRNRSLKKYQQSLLGKFKKYRTAATDRALGFSLTISQFKELWGKPCFYCLTPIEKIGLDRVENSTGYTTENIVPCCATCNRMKLAWAKEFFIEHCRKIVQTADARKQ